MMPAFLLLCAYKNDILDMFGEAGEKPARARRRNTHIFSPLPAPQQGLVIGNAEKTDEQCKAGISER